MTISKDGIPITDLALWGKHGGPKRPSQWIAGRSAMELARAWLASAHEGRLPAEIDEIISAHPAFGPVLEWKAEPEVKLHFDSFRGEPRNTDLLVHARDRHGEFVIAVEGKADEPFGETVSDALGAALERQVSSEGRSMGIRRIEQLVAALFRTRRTGDAEIPSLRYQLLTATAGALSCATEKITRVMLLIHEFETSKTSDEKHRLNAADLDQFLSRLSQGTVTSIVDRQIVGPLRVPGEPLFTGRIDLYVGKVVRRLRGL